jgi:hypothetical protein
LSLSPASSRVVGPQPLQAVGQVAVEPPRAPAHDRHVEQLLLHGQVALDFDGEGRAAEEVGQLQAERAVPVAQRLPLDGHRTALLGRARLYPPGGDAAAPPRRPAAGR